MLPLKATIDFDDTLYRLLKVEAARRGRTIRDLVADGVRLVLDAPDADVPEPDDGPAPWFGVLSGYAANAGGRHDLEAIRGSVAAGRSRRRT